MLRLVKCVAAQEFAIKDDLFILMRNSTESGMKSDGVSSKL